MKPSCRQCLFHILCSSMLTGFILHVPNEHEVHVKNFLNHSCQSMQCTNMDSFKWNRQYRFPSRFFYNRRRVGSDITCK
ncbi:hypothetical protein KC19_VG241600 [Ceratodon purpureus]|uniref:Secreted protein n=1 Tax=Ceratodon purpureus TaxID=3225 RepID=A0A8T0HTA3_CERPU|nr:hypothetical protein KC19_VG241600 [Ceratodon purpureus]